MEATPCAIIVSGTSFLAKNRPTMDVKSIAALLSLSIASLSSQEYTVDCSVTYNDGYSVGKTVYEPTEKDLVVANSGGTCLYVSTDVLRRQSVRRRVSFLEGVRSAGSDVSRSLCAAMIQSS